MSLDPALAICPACNHPASQHGRSGCYRKVDNFEPPIFCNCQKTAEQVLLLIAEAKLDRFRYALLHSRAVLLKFNQGDAISIEQVLSALTESGELLTEEP